MSIQIGSCVRLITGSPLMVVLNKTIQNEIMFVSCLYFDKSGISHELLLPISVLQQAYISSEISNKSLEENIIDSDTLQQIDFALEILDLYEQENPKLLNKNTEYFLNKCIIPIIEKHRKSSNRIASFRSFSDLPYISDRLNPIEKKLLDEGREPRYV